MNKQYTIFFLIAALVCVSLLMGSASIAAAKYYTNYTKLLSKIRTTDDLSFSRSIVIESINTDDNTIIATYAHPLTGKPTRFLFSVSNGTIIASRRPTMRNDIIVGYAPPSKMHMTDMRPHATAFGTFQITDTGTYSASTLIFDDPGTNF